MVRMKYKRSAEPFEMLVGMTELARTEYDRNTRMKTAYQSKLLKAESTVIPFDLILTLLSIRESNHQADIAVAPVTVNARGNIEIEDKARKGVDGGDEVAGKEINELGENLEIPWEEFLHLGISQLAI